jgi:hypothetical protein
MIQPAEVQYLQPAKPTICVRLTVCLVVVLPGIQPPTNRPGARLLDLCPLSRWVWSMSGVLGSWAWELCSKRATLQDWPMHYRPKQYLTASGSSTVR